METTKIKNETKKEKYEKFKTVINPPSYWYTGAFSDGSSWKKVIPMLGGTRWVYRDAMASSKIPSGHWCRMLKPTKRVIEAQKGDVVLVGHSYGGSVITDAAAGNDKVKALVYVAAFAPDAGETVGGLIGKFPPADLGTALAPDSASFLYIDRAKFHHVFAGDVPEGEASVMAATQKPIAAECLRRAGHVCCLEDDSLVVCRDHAGSRGNATPICSSSWPKESGLKSRKLRRVTFLSCLSPKR